EGNVHLVRFGLIPLKSTLHKSVYEQFASCCSVFYSACCYSPVLPVSRRDCSAPWPAASRSGNAGRRASRTIAFWFALAGSAALAFPVGQQSENARHPKLFVSSVATRSRALHVCGWNGIPHRHRAQQIDKLNRRVGGGNADTFRTGRRPGLDSILSHGALSKDHFALGGNALSWRIPVS